MIVPIAFILFILSLVFGAVLLCALKWRNRKLHKNEQPVARGNQPDEGAGNLPAPPLQGNHVNDAPPQVVVNQQDNNGLVDLPAPQLQGNDVNDAPPQGVVNTNQQDNDGPVDPPDHPLQGNNIPPDTVAHDNPPDDGAGDPPAPLLEGDDDGAPSEVIVHDNRQGDGIIGDHTPVMDVPVSSDLPFEDDGVGSLPSVFVAPEHGVDVALAMPIPARDNVSFSNALLVARYAAVPEPLQVDVECVTEENLPPPQEERKCQNQEQQRPAECTDRNLSYRSVDAIHRKASTSSGDSLKISRPWLQCPASSPNRATSEASVCLFIHRSCKVKFIDCSMCTIALLLTACLYLCFVCVQLLSCR